MSLQTISFFITYVLKASLVPDSFYRIGAIAGVADPSAHNSFKAAMRRPYEDSADIVVSASSLLLE